VTTIFQGRRQDRPRPRVGGAPQGARLPEL